VGGMSGSDRRRPAGSAGTTGSQGWRRLSGGGGENRGGGSALPSLSPHSGPDKPGASAFSLSVRCSLFSFAGWCSSTVADVVFSLIDGSVVAVRVVWSERKQHAEQ